MPTLKKKSRRIQLLDDLKVVYQKVYQKVVVPRRQPGRDVEEKPSFEDDLNYVMDKNRELYKRLA